MKIIVTGASGFIGRVLSNKLEAQGHEVTRLDSTNCDLRKANSLEQFGRNNYNQLYHLAAWTQAGDFCLHHPGEQWLINQQINTNVLSWWHHSQPQAKLICMGTSCAYAPDELMIEENYLKGLPIESLFTYAMTKRMLYVGMLALNKQYDLDYLCIVPSTVYGPNYHTDGRQMHFIFDLIRKILRGKQNGEPVVLWGDGDQCREVIYVNDFVDIVLRLAAVAKNELINVGTGEEFSIKQFAQNICDEVDFDPNTILFDTARYVGARSKCLDIRKLHSHIPDLSFTSLKDGLKKTIAWCEFTI